MASQRRVSARILLGLGAVVGVALAAEPIFVTPPVEKGGVSRSDDPLADIPLAKTLPLTSGKKGIDTTDLPVFIEPAAAEVNESSPATAPPAAKPASPNPNVSPAADETPPSEPPAADPVQPPESDGGDAASMPLPVPLGLGFKSISIDSKLPPEIGIVQIALAKTVDKTQRLPRAGALAALCADAKKIEGLVEDLAGTPLIEVTTHFSLWREGMAALRSRVDAYRRACRKPGDESVEAFRRVVAEFDALLETR